MTAASARIVAAVRTHIVCGAVLCCAITVDNSGVYVYYLKDIVSVCFRRPAIGLWVSLEHAFTCVYNQPS